MQNFLFCGSRILAIASVETYRERHGPRLHSSNGCTVLIKWLNTITIQITLVERQIRAIHCITITCIVRKQEAERLGFEPRDPVKGQLLSRQLPSAARPPLHFISQYIIPAKSHVRRYELPIDLLSEVTLIICNFRLNATDF